MGSTSTGSQTWTVDVAHATIGFAVRHTTISQTRITFTRVKSSLQIPEGSAIPESIFVEIDAASLQDFFDVKKYPVLTFVSTSIEDADGRTFEVTGDLTIHGTTKAITLPARVEGQRTDPFGNRRIDYAAQFSIDRRDFGLSFNHALKTSGIFVGDEVDIELQAEAVLGW